MQKNLLIFKLNHFFYLIGLLNLAIGQINSCYFKGDLLVKLIVLSLRSSKYISSTTFLFFFFLDCSFYLSFSFFDWISSLLSSSRKYTTCKVSSVSEI